MGFWDSLFGGSPGAAEREMARRYARLAEKLSQKKIEIMTEKTLAETSLESLHTKFTSNEDSAEGLIITDFDTHVASWQENYKAILNNIDIALSVLGSRIVSAQIQQSVYLAKAAMAEAAAAEANENG